MLKHYTKILLISIGLLIVFLETKAQNDKYANTSLPDKIEKLHQQGLFDSISVVLEKELKTAAITKTLPELKRAELYKILATSYIYLKRPEMADEPLKKMLELRPDYKENGPINNDLQIIQDKINDMYVVNGLSAGINISNTTSLIDCKETFELLYFEENINQIVQYNGEMVFPSVEISAEYMPLKHFSLNTGAAFNMYKYGFLSETPNDDLKSFLYTQTISYVSFPVSLKIYPLIAQTKQLSYFLEGGVETSRLISARRNADENTTPNSKTFNTTNLSVIGGIGIKYSLTEWTIGAGLRYRYGLNLIINEDNRYHTDNLSDIFMYGNYNIPDNISLNSISINFSLLYTLKHKVFEKR